ncbi:hypothetical protein C2845_PM04G06970 [Panicum miliaceum]|uniref:Uncharacterized protein n=1 Tax=Panicum miliaceum TaxID=4540 RepID=A0A3L6QUV1_PANMI|nr:hypothetical protein C2845_PM04G06970 [Panicum miliaceum]
MAREHQAAGRTELAARRRQHAFRPRRARNGPASGGYTIPEPKRSPPDKLTQTRGAWRTWLTGGLFFLRDNGPREEDDGELAAAAVVSAREGLKWIAEVAVMLVVQGI